ncbi:histidine kinase [Streptomyces sp. NPDC049577]|uniref:histidine kinase n=1 Tax=Streptomyces sp. NPDC049577 TaxID=3155153 RepID=UPI00342F03B7
MTADLRPLEALCAVRATERLELASELHDHVAHQVAAVTVLAKAAALTSADERVGASLRAIQEAGDEALRTARRLLEALGRDVPRK